FQWTETGEASFYLLEAADNPGMTNPVLSREVQGSSFYFSEMGPGTWYWRVRPVFPPSYEGAPGEASPASFSISQSGSLRTPELLIPQDQGRVDVGQGDVYFSWLPETEARSYRILISADRNLTNPLIDETASDNFYVYRPGRNIIAPGQYYWAVSQIDIEGNNSSFSPARSFTALEGELTQRLVFPPDGYITAAARLPDLRFTWKTNLPLQTRFQISGYSDFSSLLIDEAAGSETFQGRILPEGTWYWRIQAKGPDNAVFETPPRSFTAAPPIPAPVLLAPSLNGRIAVQEGEPTAFSWETAEGAAYYQFKLYYGENRNNPVYENNLVEGTRQSLSMDSYPEGNYYWTVQGFMPETAQSTRRTGLLSEGDFSIRKLHLVSLNYPGNGAAFEGLRAYLEPGTVRWSSVNQVSASRFIFSRNQDFSGTPVAVINNPPGTISLPRLRAGNYYWTIQAETPDGFNISARPRLLRVLPIQPLPDAANRLPTDGTIIGREELRENRNIRFSWDTVPGATAYIFTLENIDTGKTIIQKSPSPETSFVLEDLTLLDVGAFVWRVEAVLINPLRERRADDEILRRGESTGNGFRIDFGLPVTPELRRPGQLYGR
ncbi:MAG: hypothetical protein LBK64_05170, partial [Spirochaetaceae bacterium]|nr:hypothetical protein [Spirochaetaceae bacterium]